ncbi:tape measure protein [Acinetobacter rudis]|uniref:tape measure protein n=1 Tax=Acinetobacter rudis TaxID=632955 RepID=UPI00280EDD53|nr:tape measure protein [Acinetobacter rudis]MDQ8952437.1 tape measure protein [Acinetobacter rudis]
MSKQESRLSIAIDSQEAVRNAKAVHKELKSIQETGDFAAKSVEGTSKSLTTFSQEGAKGASSAKVLAGQIGSVGTQSKTASDGLSKVAQSSNASVASMNMASTAAQALASRIMAIATVGAAVSKMDALTGLENRLKLVTNSQTELNKAMSDTFTIAQNTRQSWDSAAQVYQGFANNAKTLGLDMQKTAVLTETVSKAVAISGSSTQAAEAALVQFNQALSSGVLRGEELNSVMEQAPGLAKAIAQGMGITVGQLRTVAAEGKITSDVLVQALTKSKDSVDELFGKTSSTIGQSLTMLDNEITKFVGEAGKSSGAASALAGSIQTLANNLDLATSAAMIGGAYWLGTYIPAVYKSVTAGYAKVQSTVAEIRAEQLANEITVQRSARIAHLTTVELANAQAQAARMSGIAKVAFVEKTLIPLEQANTAAIAANTVVQDANNKSKLLGVGIGSRLLGVLGGPVGLGLTVAGVAASMLLMSGNTKTANEDLKDQSKYAEMANEELAKLEGNKKKFATEILTAELELQNNQLKAAQKEFEALTETIANSNKGNIEAERIWAQVKAGVMTAEQAVAAYNQAKFITSSQMTQLEDGQAKIKGLELKVDDANTKLHQVKPASDVAAGGIDKVGNAAANTELKVAGMSAAYQQFLDKAKSNAAKELWVSAYAERTGMTTDEARFFYDAKQANQGKTITQEQANQLDLIYKQGQASKDLDEHRQKAAQAQAKSDKDATKEAEKQLKLKEKQAVLLAGNDERTRNMLRVYQSFRGAGLGDKQARVMTAQVGRENDFVSSAMFGSHKDRNNGYTNTGFISWQKERSANLMKFLQGQGVLDKKGNIQQSQEALNAMAKFLVQEISTTNAYGKTKNALQNDNLSYRELEKIVGTNFIGWDYVGNKLGSKTSAKHLKKQDGYYEKLSNILGKDPEGVMGAIGGLSRFEDEAYKARAKTEEEISQLQAQYDTDAIKRSKDREEAINKATILGQTDLLSKINERYDAQDTLASLQFDNELNGYKWTEEQKINYHNETAKLMLDIDGKYSEKGKAALKTSLDNQRDLELSAYRHLQQEKQFTYDQEIAKRRREIDDRMARNTMGGDDYQRYVLAQGQKDEYKANDDQLTTDLANIEKQKREGEFADIQEYYRRLEEAKLLHKENELAISHEYQKKEADVLASQKAAQFQLWGSLVSQGQTTWSQMTQSVKDGAGEQSASYKTMFAMQQAFSIASTLIATHLAAMQVTADGANPTLFGKVTAHSAILAMGYAQAGLIASQAIAGFATGGQISGKGSGTSDDIPIMASNGEYMIREFAASKLGLQTLNYINKTGELPYQKFQEHLLLQQESKNPATQGFSTGGLVGSPQQSSPTIERQRLIAVRENIATKQSSEPTVSIHQSITFDTSNGETKIDTSGQKALAESLNGAMNNWARRESMQGGVLFNAIKRIK